MARPNVRNLISSMICGVGLPDMARAVQILALGPQIRAVNVHATPPHLRDNMRKQFEMLRMWFEPARLTDIAELLATGTWRGVSSGKPGLLFCYDDGCYTNYSVAAPLLEEFGFSGLFFLPVGFLDCPAADQPDWARAHDIFTDPKTDSAPDGRQAMSWAEARELLAKHEVGAHTRTHCRMWPTVSNHQVRDEIVTAKQDLEERMGRTVDSFCWVGGDVGAHSSVAAALIREAGFKFAFSTGSAPIHRDSHPLSLQRTQLEAAFPLTRVKMSGSGLIDLYFYRRRRSIVAAMEDQSALAMIQEWEDANPLPEHAGPIEGDEDVPGPGRVARG
jgi:peptidoglycan/xylan/chitin deacetylase (PgdA/CDA1 family)